MIFASWSDSGCTLDKWSILSISVAVFTAILSGITGCLSKVQPEQPYTVTAESLSQAQLNRVCTITGESPSQTIVIGNLVRGASTAKRGAILFFNGVITDIGTRKDMRSRAPRATVYDCKQAYVSPGLINAHEHPNWSNGFPDPNMERNYTHRDQWQGKAGSKHYKIKYEEKAEDISVFWVELRHLLAGTTTLAGTGAVAGLVKNVNGPPDEQRYAYRVDMQTFPYGTATAELAKQSCPFTGKVPREPRLREHFPMHKPYVPHIAEGTNCTAELEGQFYLDYVARNPGRRYALIHGVGLHQSSLERLADLDVTLIWSPRSNVALYNKTVDIPKVLKSGARVALSTDWSYSGSYNMLEEFRCADTIDNSMWGNQLSGHDYWRMVTVQGAYALGLEKITGKLEAGFAADIMIFRKQTDDPYRDLMKTHVSDVIATFVDGKLSSGYRRAFNQNHLPQHCHNQVGTHFVCADYDVFTHAELVKANANAVPLFTTHRQADCPVPTTPL